MTARRALLKGLGIGITAYLAVIGCLTLFGLELGDLPQLRSYTSCITAPEAAEGPAADCGWLTGSSGAEEASSHDDVATRVFDGVKSWSSSLFYALMDFTEKWIAPIGGRLQAVADFVGEHFMR